MSLAVFAILAIARHPDLLSLTNAGQPPRQVIETIAKQTGLELRVRDDANVNTLVLSVDDVPAEVLLAKIAEVTGTEWLRQDDRRTLVTTDETNNRLSRSESEYRRSAVRDAIDRLPPDAPTDRYQIESLIQRAEEVGKGLHEWIPTDEERAVIRDIQLHTPINRLVDRVLRELSTEDLASVALGAPLVMSDRPVGKEKRLPRGVAAALSDYKRDYQIWLDAVMRSVAAFPVKNPEDPRYLAKNGPPPVFLHLTVDAIPERPYLRVDLRTVAENGTFVDRGSKSLRLELSGEPLALEPNASMLVPLATRALRAYLTFEESVLDHESSHPVVEEVRPRILDPIAHDPVSNGAGPLLVSLAKSIRKDLVACVSDVALDWFAVTGRIAEQTTVNAVLRDAYTSWGLQAQVKDDWLLIAPREPLTARRKYYDRDALKALFLIQAQNRIVRHQDAIEYARDQRSVLAFRGYDSRVVLLHGTFNGNVADSHLLHWESEKPLRVLGELTASELSGAMQSGVQVSSLSAGARAAVAAWLTDFTALFGGFRTAGQEDFVIGNVVQLPSRAQGAMRLRVVDASEPMTFQIGPGAWRGLPFADYLEYSGQIYQDAIENTPEVRVQMGVLRKLALRLELPEGPFVEVSIDQALAPPTEKWLRPRELLQRDLDLLKSAFDKSGG